MTLDEPEQPVEAAATAPPSRPQWLWIVGAVLIALALVGAAVAFKVGGGPPYDDVDALISDLENMGYRCSDDYVVGDPADNSAFCLALEDGPNLSAKVFSETADVDQHVAEMAAIEGYFDQYLVIGEQWTVLTPDSSIANVIADGLDGEVRHFPADAEMAEGLQQTQSCANTVAGWTAQLIDGTGSLQQMAYAIGYDSFEAQTVIAIMSEARRKAFSEGAGAAAEFIQQEAFDRCNDEYGGVEF